MYKACYMQCMYGGSTVSPWSGDVPLDGFMVGRNDLAETVFVQSVYDPVMGAMNLPEIQVPRQEYMSQLAIAWAVQATAISRLKQHTLRPQMYVGTWDNKQGQTEVDISQRFTDMDEALDRCRVLGEKCIWDVKSNKEIYV